MKKNRAGILAGIVSTAFILLLGGCSLAGVQMEGYSGPDKLIGVFITREYLDLFDMEGYLNDHAGQLAGGDFVIDAGEGKEYQEKKYAVFQKQDGQGMGEYVFEGIEGIPFFMPFVTSDSNPEEKTAVIQQGPEISDGHFTSGESIELEGVIYYSGKDSPQFYCNPVYQSPDGSVYLTAGNGMSGQLSSGVSHSMQLSETYTESAMGTQRDGAERNSSGIRTDKEISSEVKITIQGKAAGGKCTILQMNEDSRIIRETSGEQAEEAGVLKIEKDTSYIIVESYGQEGEKAERELFNLGEDDNYISIYTQGADGIILKKDIRTELKHN